MTDRPRYPSFSSICSEWQPHISAGLRVRILRQAAAELAAIRARDCHNVTAAELAIHADHTDRKQAVAAAQCTHCTFIYMQGTTHLQHTREPLLARSGRRPFRLENRAASAVR